MKITTRLNSSTKIIIGVGDPIKQTLSPKMHNPAYQALGIDDQFVYLSARVTEDNLSSALAGARALGIRGISVTVPHKQEAIKYLDEIDQVAKKIGAVNTILNNNGQLKGYNTDWIGAITSLEKRTQLKGKRVALFGAGGAARAIVYGLIKKGALVKIYNRTKEKSKKLAQEFHCLSGNLNQVEEIKEMDIIINATTLGMEPNISQTPLPNKFIEKHHLVFDIVFKPSETRLIREAKHKGAKVIYGYEMLLYQGVEQFKLYTGIDAPVEIMKEALVKSLNGKI